ncbi:MAG TPA: glycine cleavage T C-terminal barrel domain-containing protein [Verrucomicrobiae bacterium]|nr:glycine cleavage T C-terminal barrel domain-containing protein [Verrucomicrobiae bacterium]
MNELLREPSARAGGRTIVDLSSLRERLRITGADRVEFLQGQCTNDIKRLQPGQSCYAAFLNAKGKMRGEGQVICLADSFLLEVNPGLAPSLEKFIITEEVTIEDVGDSMSEWLVIGDEIGTVPPQAVTFQHPLGWGVISATPMMETISAEALEVLRIEGAVPKWGVDMDESMIPNEAGLEARAISYDKGCYIGQETIARIKTYGHVNRRLVQIVITGESIPTRGDKIVMEGREVGQLTSAIRSSRLGKPLALGYVRREFATAGVKLNWNTETAEVLRVCGE